jgi:hypothetical protein
MSPLSTAGNAYVPLRSIMRGMSSRPIFRCATHQVEVEMTDPEWAEKLLSGECPLCAGSRLRPKLVAKPLDVMTDLHGEGYLR